MSAADRGPERRSAAWHLKALVGSGDRIMLSTLPFFIGGVALHLRYPQAFSCGGPPPALKVLSSVISLCGLAIWSWSVVLILTRVPRGELITSGPYAWVKHPLYTSVALLVLPWVGVWLDTWLGALLGLSLYIASRIFSPAEEQQLAHRFGTVWQEYCDKVRLPWL